MTKDQKDTLDTIPVDEIIQYLCENRVAGMLGIFIHKDKFDSGADLSSVKEADATGEHFFRANSKSIVKMLLSGMDKVIPDIIDRMELIDLIDDLAERMKDTGSSDEG